MSKHCAHGRSTAPLDRPEQACVLANPHSSAFIDIDGDCLPDLVLHCSKSKSAGQSIQIWINKGDKGYQLAQTYDLPKGAGPLTFADMSELDLPCQTLCLADIQTAMGRSISSFRLVQRSPAPPAKAQTAPSISPTTAKSLYARRRPLPGAQMAV